MTIRFGSITFHEYPTLIIGFSWCSLAWNTRVMKRAALRPSRSSKPGAFAPTPVFESLEQRMLLSGDSSLSATLGVIPAMAVEGVKLNAPIEVSIANSGPDFYKGKTNIQLVASPDGTYSASDPLLGKTTKSLGIAVGSSKNVSIKVATVPKSLSGDIYVVANVIEPTTSTQGASTTTMLVSAPFVDLSVTVGAIPAAAVAGGKLNAPVELTISNSGNVAYKGKTAIQLVASPDGTYSSSDPLLVKTTKSLRIAAGSSKNVSVKVGALPKSLSGKVYVVANVIEPTSSTQDASATTMLVTAPFVDLSDGFDPNDPPVVQFTQGLELVGLTFPLEVSNLGNEKASGPLKIVIGISSSSTGANPQTITTVTKHINIKPDTMLTLKLSKLGRGFSLPQGEAFFVVTIDPNNTFDESSLANNTVVSTEFFFNS